MLQTNCNRHKVPVLLSSKHETQLNPSDVHKQRLAPRYPQRFTQPLPSLEHLLSFATFTDILTLQRHGAGDPETGEELGVTQYIQKLEEGRSGSPGPSCTLSLLPTTQGTKELTLRSCDLMLLMTAEERHDLWVVLNTATGKLTPVLSAEPTAESGFPGDAETGDRISFHKFLMQHLLTMAVPGWKGPGFERRHKP